MFESVVLGLLGSLLGLALAYGRCACWWRWRRRVCRAFMRSELICRCCCLRWGLRFFPACCLASIPIFKYAGAHLNTGLREGGRALSQSRQQHRARNVLVVVQVALALVLLICSGLMIRTFRALMHVPPGFAAPDSVQTFRFYVPETEIPDKDRERRGADATGHSGKTGGDSGSCVSELWERYSDGWTQLDGHFIRGGPRVRRREASAHPAF